VNREISGHRGYIEQFGNGGSTARRLRDGAESQREKSLAFRELEHKQGIAASLGGLGRIAQELGDYDAAFSFYEESLALRRELGDKIGIATSLGNLGETARYQGDYLQATALFEESMALCRSQDDKRLLPPLLHSLGEIAREQGDYNRAIAFFYESLKICREKGEKRNIPFCLEGLAAVAAMRKQAERAAYLFGAAATMRDVMKFPLPPVLHSSYESVIAIARNALDDKTFTSAWRKGQIFPLEQTIADALQTVQ
jgi:tetratricopeptide (TPR) repeat protein